MILFNPPEFYRYNNFIWVLSFAGLIGKESRSKICKFLRKKYNATK